MGGGDAPEVPAISPQEEALFGAQTGLLNQASEILGRSADLTELLTPELLKAAGFDAQVDATGRITGVTRTADANAQGRADIEAGLIERSKAALSGDLPLDPVLLKELAQQEEDLNNRIRDRLGPGADVSSPGIEALGDFGLNKAIAKSDSARKDLVTSEGLRLQAQGGNESLIDSLIARTLGISQGGLPAGQSLAGVSAGFNAPIGKLQNDRFAQFEAEQAQFEADQSFTGALFSGLGSVAGLAAFSPTKGTNFGRIFGGG